MTTWRQFTSYPPAVRLLLVNQLAINLGFYMLMPYLAAHLSGSLGLAAATVGLILGVRNLTQQGMFLAGGAAADRFGFKPLIVAGCTLRTAGFGLLAVVDTVPALVVACAATGLAGALFNPAVRAYLAHDAGPRRVEAFALFNVFYQAGILAGPPIGLALGVVSFRLTCALAALLFAALSLLQARALPSRRPQPDDPATAPSLRRSLAGVVANRALLGFAAAMAGSYILGFQVYLALPLHLSATIGGEAARTIATTALFAIPGIVTLAGQVRVTAWCKKHATARQCLAAGVAVMGLAFLPVAAAAALHAGAWTTAAAAVLTSVGLTAGTMLAYPFEMDTIVTAAGGQQVATHYGLFQTICGLGITAGNLGVGAAIDAAHGQPALPFLALTGVGLTAATALAVLLRPPRTPSTPAALHPPELATTASR